MPKKYKLDKKAGTNFDLTTDFLIENHYTISNKIKIGISQFIAKILLKR